MKNRDIWVLSWMSMPVLVGLLYWYSSNLYVGIIGFGLTICFVVFLHLLKIKPEEVKK